MQAQLAEGQTRSAAWRLALLALLCALLTWLATPQAAQAANFTVNNTGDTVDASPGNGVCGDATNACTLRAAIMEANALAGADIITLPDGTFTLSRSGSDDNATNGDLDVTGPLTINGNSQAGTIIQAGTTNTNGIDKIFSFNPVGAGTGFAVTLTNLTLRFGRNPETYANFNGFGGCLDFDAGTNAAAPGSLTLNSVTVTDCSTTDADGGGLALFLNKGGTINISNSTLQNNKAGTNANATSGLGGAIFFGTTDAGSTVNVTFNNSTVANNQALGGAKQGGGLFIFGGAGTSNYQLHAVTISGNSAASDGGGIYATAPLLIDQGSVISNNSSGRSGGGIWLNHANRTSTISKVTISGNQATDGGGGIRLDSGSPNNNLNLSFSRLVNNTAGSGKGSGLSVNNGTATAVTNWWGCSTGPSTTPCDTAKVDPGSGGGAAGTGSVNVTPWLRLNLTAATNPLVTGQSTGLTASFLTDSNGGAVALSNLSVLLGLPVTWSGVGGTIAGQQATIQAAGTATANYQATAAAAGNLAVAKVDNDGTTSGSNVLSLTVNKANTTAAITADTPDPSVPGESVTVNYNVTANAPGAGTPTGNVSVSDGVNGCTGTVAAGTCTLTLSTIGARTLTATYAGDANFNGSTAAGVAHTVNKANTTTTITADTPDPSDVSQAVTVQYNVTVNAPSAGTPTGNVTVSDGVASCTATVADGQCTLALTTSGARTLTATYAGDANFNTSTSTGVPHSVNAPTQAPQITSQPTAQNVCAGATATFSAAASGSPTPTVQWQVSSDNGATWNDLSGETSPTLNVVTSAADNGKQYRAVFTNNAGSATTNAATLTVNSAAAITTQPSNQTVAAGQSVSFSAAASGSPAPTVQWQVSSDNGTTWNDLGGETATTLSFTAQSSDNGKQYRAVFTNSCGTATSAAATLTINTPQADLTTSKANNVSGNAVTGQSWNWTITVNNTGGAGAVFPGSFIILSDNLPNGDIVYGTPIVVNVTNVTGNEGISCTIDSNQNLVCLVVGAPVVLGAFNGSFGVQIPATASAVGAYANPRSGGSCSADPDLKVTESNEANNACNSDTVTVTAAPTPDLTISKSHTGNFTQGQTGAQYTIQVTNNGTGPASGTVTVVDTLPAGLTATALSGSGWNCTLATLTCTRSDGLVAGSSYPDLILTVNVASNAPASVTNSATVAGGGEQNSSNNTANDPTTVNQPPPTTAVLLISSNGNGSVPGLSYRDEDIIAYSNGVWSMVFDGSDVGLGNNDIDDFAILPSGKIVLSVEKDFTLGGMAVGDEDILEFTPTALGDATAGAWSLYFDGSDVGLDANKDDEDIKALDFDSTGRLVISVRGNFDALGVKGDDKDLFTFTGTTGATTSGTWEVRLDGSDIKLKEDLRGVWLDNSAGELYLTVESDFLVTANEPTPPPNVTVKGDKNDIFICKQLGIGSNTICAVRFHLDVGGLGLGKNGIDGLSLGKLPMVQTSIQVTGAVALDDTVIFAGDDVDEAGDSDEEQEVGYSIFLSTVAR